MPVGVAGEHIENLPFKQVLGVNSWVGRCILKEAVTPTEGWTSVLLIFVLMPITQCLAKVLLVQSIYLAVIILIPIVSPDNDIGSIDQPAKLEIDGRSSDGTGKHGSKSFVGRNILIVRNLKLENVV